MVLPSPFPEATDFKGAAVPCHLVTPYEMTGGSGEPISISFVMQTDGSGLKATAIWGVGVGDALGPLRLCFPGHDTAGRTL